MKRKPAPQAAPDPLTPVQRRVAASDMPPPRTNGARSAFDLVAPPPKAARKHETFDPLAVVIEDNVPLPDVPPARSSRYLALLSRMKPGQMVRLSKKQALSVTQLARKHNIKTALRQMGDVYGVWRLE